jgi:hypothetical protein
MRHATTLVLLLAALIVFAALQPADATPAAEKSGPGGIARRVVSCNADGVKDTQINVYNPAMTEATITVKVASTSGFGTPVEYVLSPMGLRRFDCSDASALYGGAVKRAVFVVESDSDVASAGCTRPSSRTCRCP